MLWLAITALYGGVAVALGVAAGTRLPVDIRGRFSDPDVLAKVDADLARIGGSSRDAARTDG